ncbi:NAD(P)/FAD-dependent oxidoreductase [Galactobacter valiniphilus]|uniref:NAD(P)/FAD-dependent oxidoreductase n=1 Tax=Galactobacter valiniphilus TaxID=2676122 RepID=UPI0037352B32
MSESPASAPSTAVVIGAGVIGLSCALGLSRAGWSVTIVAEQPATETVSGVAGGIWFPYKAEASPRAERLLKTSFDRFVELADDPASGVDLVEGLWVERLPGTDRSWRASARNVRRAPEGEVPRGARDGIVAELPIIDMPTFLPWLAAQATAAGVTTLEASVDSVGQALDVVRSASGETPALAVVAAGEGSGAILGDDATGYPIRGQVVKLEQAGITHWLVDDDHEDGMIYVIPRRNDVVVGGTADEGETDTTYSQETEDAILRRAIEAYPALAGLAVKERAVGLRPARPALRLEEAEGQPVRTLAAYGHGGAGVTLCWGTAEEIVELAGPAS